ncbi:MAG: 2,3-bisphosphoglycerate-independent phosphoglycerate mutase [Thermoprotei archaeon]
MKKYKILMIILDGASDNPKYGLTPLDLADTPSLTHIASGGYLGLMYTIDKNVAPESDAAAFSLLGYDPNRYLLSRGVIEALGADLEFRDGWLALRCNFATSEGNKIIDRRVGRNLTLEEAKKLASDIEKNIKLDNADFSFKSTIGHRAVLVIRDHNVKLSDAISNYDPAYEKMGSISVAKSTIDMTLKPCTALDDSYEAKRAAQLVNEFSEKVQNFLKNHPINIERIKNNKLPANIILMRDAGSKYPNVEPFEKKFATKPVIIADMPVELGIAKVLGFSLEKFTPERSPESYEKRANTAVDLLKKFNFVYVHLKGPDEPGHDKDCEGKRRAIEDIDRYFISNIINNIILDDTIIVVTADHSTPCKLGSHSTDPVPLAIYGGNFIKKHVKKRKFSEREAEKGELGIIDHGYDLIPKLLSLIQKV